VPREVNGAPWLFLALVDANISSPIRVSAEAVAKLSGVGCVA
jgi:hypothetical protein